MKKPMYMEEILEICYNNHLTVEEILNKLKKKFPKVWIATVYRSVNFLVKEWKMRKIENINKTTYYETLDKPHLHFIDEETWEIIDIPFESIEIKSPIFEQISDIRIFWKIKK